MIRSHREDPDLRGILINCVEHIYDNHDNCTDECPYKGNPDKE